MKPDFIYSDGSAEFPNGLLRENYARHHTIINTMRDFLATLRAGPYAWPGGYPLYFLTRDGAAISFDAFNRAARGSGAVYALYNALDEIRTRGNGAPVSCEVNWEDPELRCEYTGKRIPSAYPED